MNAQLELQLHVVLINTQLQHLASTVQQEASVLMVMSLSVQKVLLHQEPTQLHVLHAQLAFIAQEEFRQFVPIKLMLM